MDIRRLVSNLCKKMFSLGMNVSGTSMCLSNIDLIFLITAGFTSDGEFNYLRTKGYTRPISVLQIRTDVRNKFSRISAQNLLAMLTPKS